MKKVFLLLYIALALLSCNQLKSTFNSSNSIEVKYAGALKNMMHKGDISAQANLNDLKNSHHLYALGALENLKGEIQIFDSQPFNSIVDNKKLLFDSTYNKKATLLVYASVPKWDVFEIPDDIITDEHLEKYIEQTASTNGIDINAPFPFLLEGTPASFDWHVIDWKEGDMEHSHEKHIRSGLYGTIKEEPVEMLGFYSNAHHAIFTHHSTNMHIHVRVKDGEVAGHVDELTLEKGMILKLPKNNN